MLPSKMRANKQKKIGGTERVGGRCGGRGVEGGHGCGVLRVYLRLKLNIQSKGTTKN